MSNTFTALQPEGAYTDLQSAYNTGVNLSISNVMFNELDDLTPEQQFHMQMGLDPYDLTLHSNALIRQVGTDNWIQSMQQLSDSDQRAAWLQLDDAAMKDAIEAGYEGPPEASERNWLQTAWAWSPFGVASKVGGWTLGKTAWPVAKGAFKGADWLWQRSTNLWRTFSQADIGTQITMIAGATAATAGVIATVGTGGLASPIAAPLTFLGTTTLIGATAAAGAAAGGIAAGTADAALGTNSPSHQNFFELYSATWDGEKYFTPETKRRNAELLGHSAYAELAANLSDNPNFDQNTLVETLVGRRDPLANPATIVETATQLIEESFVRGTPEFDKAIQSVSILLNDSKFKYAMQDYQNSKISFGKDLANTLQIDRDSSLYTLVSGTGDALFAIFADPLNLIGGVGQIKQSRNIWKGLSLSLDRRAIMQVVEEANPAGFIRAAVEEKPAAKQLFNSMADAFNAGRIDQLPAHFRPSAFNMLDYFRNVGVLNESGTFSRALTGDDIINYWDSTQGVTDLLQGRGLRRGERMMLDLRSSDSIRGRLTRGLQNFRDAYDEEASIKVMKELLEDSEFETLSQLYPAEVFTNHQIGVVKLFDPILDETAKTFGGKLGKSLAFLTRDNDSLRKFIVRTTNMAPSSAVTDFNDPTQLMRYIETMGDMMSLPKSIRQTWVNTVLMQSTPIGRANAFNGFMKTYFDVLNYNAFEDTAEYASKSLKEIGQIFDLAGKDLVPTLDGTVKVARAKFPHQVAVHAALPNVQDLVTYNRRLHHMKLFGTAGDTIDIAMKVWRPAVLARLGKAVRDVGEDGLSFLARAQTNGFTAELLSRGHAKRQTIEQANKWVATATEPIMPADLQRAANYNPFTRGLNTLHRLGPDGITGNFIERLQNWIDGVLKNGLIDSSSGLAQAQRNWAQKWQAGDLTKSEWLKGLLLYNKPGSWRSIGINGLDPELVNYATKGLTSRASAAMHAVSNTQEGQIAQVLSSPRDQEISFKLMGSNEYQRFYADTGGYNAALHTSRQSIISDEIVRDAWIDVLPRVVSKHASHDHDLWSAHLASYSEMSSLEQRVVSHLVGGDPAALRMIDYGLTKQLEELVPDSPVARVFTALRDDVVHQRNMFDQDNFDMFPNLRQLLDDIGYDEVNKLTHYGELASANGTLNFGQALLNWADTTWPKLASLPQDLRGHYLTQMGFISLEQQQARQTGQAVQSVFDSARMEQLGQGDVSVFGQAIPQQYLYRGTRSGINDRSMVVNPDGSLSITFEPQNHGSGDQIWSHYGISTTIYPNQALVYASGHKRTSGTMPQGVVYAIDRIAMQEAVGVSSNYEDIIQMQNLVSYGEMGDPTKQSKWLAEGWAALQPNRPQKYGAQFGEVMFIDSKTAPVWPTGQFVDVEPRTITIPADKWKTLSTQEMAVEVPSPWDDVLFEWDDFIRSQAIDNAEVGEPVRDYLGRVLHQDTTYTLEFLSDMFADLDNTIQSFRSLREDTVFVEGARLRDRVFREIWPDADDETIQRIYNMVSNVGIDERLSDYTYPWLEEIGVPNLEDAAMQVYRRVAQILQEEYSPAALALFDFHINGIIDQTYGMDRYSLLDTYTEIKAKDSFASVYPEQWGTELEKIFAARATGDGTKRRNEANIFRQLNRMLTSDHREVDRFLTLMNKNNLDPRAVKYREFVEQMTFKNPDAIDPFREGDIEENLTQSFIRSLMTVTADQFGSSFNFETRVALERAIENSIQQRRGTGGFSPHTVREGDLPFTAAFHDWIFGDGLGESYRNILLSQYDDIRARGYRPPVNSGAPIYQSLADARQELVDRVFMQLLTNKHKPEIQNMQRALQTETRAIAPNNAKTVYTATITEPTYLKTQFNEAVLGQELQNLPLDERVEVATQLLVDRLMQTTSARQAQSGLLNVNNEDELRTLLGRYVSYLLREDKIYNFDLLPVASITPVVGVGTSNPRYASWVQDVLNGTNMQSRGFLHGYNMPYNAPDRIGDVYRAQWENISFVDYTSNGSTYTFGNMTSPNWTPRYGDIWDGPLPQEEGFRQLAEDMVDSFFNNVGARTTENRYAREGVFKLENDEFVEVPVGTLINNSEVYHHLTPDGSYARIANNGTSSDSKFFTYELAQAGDVDDVHWGLIGPMLMDEMDKRLGWQMVSPQNHFNLQSGQTALEDDFFFYQRSRLEDVETIDASNRPNVVFGPAQPVETPQTFVTKLDALVDQALDGTVRPVFQKLGEIADTFARQPMYQHFYMHALEQNYGLAGLFVRQDDIEMLSKLFDPTVLGDLAGRYGFKPHEAAFNIADILQDIPTPMLDMVAEGKMTLRQLESHLIRSGQQGIDPNVSSIRQLGFNLTDGIEESAPEIARAIMALQSMQSKAEVGAAQQALNKVLPFIDSHNERSIASLYVRNLMPFLYAEENFIKRWSRIVMDNGYGNFAKLHDARLLAQGLNTSGYIRKDPNDNYWLVYPGSGAALDVVGRLSNLVGYDNPNLPTVYQSRLDRLLPGVNESAGRPQFGPLGTIPVAAITSLFPETKETADLKRAVLGEYGATRAWYEQIVPTQFSSLFDALTKDEDDGYIAYGSMWSNTIAMLAAKGQVPDENAEADEWEAFISRTRNGTRINLVMQSLFGVFAPMPGRPASLLVEEKDFAWWTGVGVEDPRQLINDTFYSYLGLYGLEEGTARYLAENPNADLSTIINPMALTVGKTESTIGTSLPATEIARDWVFANDEIVSKAPNGYAWFVPGRGFDNDTPEGQFSQFFFNEQMQNEVRRYLIDQSPQSAKFDAIPGMNRFLEAVIFKSQAAEYFATVDTYDNAIAQAGSSTTQGKRLQEQKQAWIKLYETQHPVFADLKNSQNGQQQREETIGDITKILANPNEMLDSPYSEAIRQLHENYEIYKIEMSRLSSSNSTYFRTQRDNLRKQWKNIGDMWALVNPDIAMLWVTVYEPESNL